MENRDTLYIFYRNIFPGRIENYSYRSSSFSSFYYIRYMKMMRGNSATVKLIARVSLKKIHIHPRYLFPFRYGIRYFRCVSRFRFAFVLSERSRFSSCRYRFIRAPRGFDRLRASNLRSSPTMADRGERFGAPRPPAV